MKLNLKLLSTIHKKIKKNVIFSISIYFIILFVVDYSGLMDLYGENISRRMFNMYKRTDPLSYSKILNPYCIKYNKILTLSEIKLLQSINIPQQNDITTLTRKNTITHQCCDDYTDNERKIISKIRQKVKKIYEKKINKKLYNTNQNPTIYKYKGSRSQHLWHVDPFNSETIYNVIICFKKKGSISPLQCKDISGNPYSIHFEEGDAAFFRGGTTVHQVPPNNDLNSERIVLSIGFTTNKNIIKGNNLCIFTDGGNNFKNIIKILIAIFILNQILLKISGIENISYSYIISLFVLNLILIRIIPLFNNWKLGTGRPVSIHHNLILLIFTVITSFSFKGGLLFLTYFMFSDVFFPRNWVGYL
tara:strand:- start:1227 stop:2309 length:1083 start_codon:yes stop_codon:yes gene_type:complete